MFVVAIAHRDEPRAASEVVPGAGGCCDAGCLIHGGPLFDDDGRRIT